MRISVDFRTSIWSHGVGFSNCSTWKEISHGIFGIIFMWQILSTINYMVNATVSILYMEQLGLLRVEILNVDMWHLHRPWHTTSSCWIFVVKVNPLCLGTERLARRKDDVFPASLMIYLCGGGQYFTNCYCRNIFVFKTTYLSPRQLQHTPRAHPRQSPWPTTKGIPL